MFISCKFMKQICIILSALFLSSCSYFGNKEEITEEKNRAIVEIQEAQKDAIESAKKEIAKIMTDQLGQANESIEKAIKSAETTISAEVEKRVEQSVKSTLESIRSDIRIASLLGLIGVVLGVAGIIFAIYSLKSRVPKEYVRAKLRHTIYEDIEFENHIKDIMRTVNRPTIGQISLTRKDVERIVMEYLNKKECANKMPSNSDIKSTSTSSSTAEKKNEDTEIASKRQCFQLFASNSSTMQLSDIQTSFQRGMSVYKLNLTDSDSTTAEVTLCVEQADVKQRILVNDSQFLLPICDVRKQTTTPTTVTVKEKGIAVKNAEGWNVMRKVLVEIK